MKLQNLPYSEDLGKLLLRLIFGGTLILNYGLPTLIDIIYGNFEYADPLSIGMGVSKILVVFGQFFCTILVLMGWWLRWACIPIAFIFLVAFFVEHHGDPFEYRELSLLYLGAFVALLLIGPGKFSISYYRTKGRL